MCWRAVGGTVRGGGRGGPTHSNGTRENRPNVRINVLAGLWLGEGGGPVRETAAEGGTRPGITLHLRWIYEFIRQSGSNRAPATENISTPPPGVSILAVITGNLRRNRRRSIWDEKGGRIFHSGGSLPSKSHVRRSYQIYIEPTWHLVKLCNCYGGGTYSSWHTIQIPLSMQRSVCCVFPDYLLNA